MRMKTLANLAADGPKKRRRGGDDDDFGANDEDWGVYRTVAKDEQSDEEEEEDLGGMLNGVEQELLEYDPDFTENHTLAAQSDWTKSLVHAFLRGPWPFDPESQREAHQIHLNVERIRVPEVVFKPSIAGVDQAGLIEIAADIINQRFSSTQDRNRLLKDVFLTGGNTLFQGFEDRFRNELRGVLPVDADLIVRQAADPVMDAWKGAAQWASGSDLGRAFVSRQEYMEKGSEYIKVSYGPIWFSGALLTNPTGARSWQRYMVNVKVKRGFQTTRRNGVESHGLPVGCFCFYLEFNRTVF
jgi:actin-related protein 5